MGRIRSAGKHINTATTTQVHSARGVFHGVVINDIGTSFNIKVYDDTGAGTSNLIADITPTVTGNLDYSVGFNNGLKVVTSGTPGSVTILAEAED